MILIEPDRTSYPPSLSAETVPGIEALTGADMIVTDCPLPFSEATLQDHIDSRALFVQIKIGYDILSFDALHNFCARVQASKIPKQQAILLRVGEYWQDDSGLFRIKGNKPYGNTTWQQYRRMLMSNGLRGITVFPECLSTIEELPGWIEDYQSVIEKIRSEGKRELYPQYTKFVPDDIWQSVVEMDKSDPRCIMVSGFPGFGSTKAQNTYDYLCSEFSHLIVTNDDGLKECGAVLLHFLKALSDEDEKGKPLHNMPGWGNKSFEDIRLWLGLPKGFNLDLREVNPDLEQPRYRDGWIMALTIFERTMSQLAEANGGKLNGQIIKEAFNATMKQSSILIEF